MLSSLLLAIALAQETRPDADALIEQGWLFVPAYDGEHRAALTPDAEREAAAAAHLFAAATALDPKHVRGLWSLGHARVLLAENAKYRRRDDEAAQRFAGVEDALGRAIAVDPSDPWVFYARGAARAGFDRLDGAYADLVQATENAAARIAESGPEGSDAWLRFKALQWRPEALMRAGDFETARAELNAFHNEFSNNSFPLGIALAESYERERDFAGAAEAYRQITVDFPSDYQAYSLLGYLAGLTGDPTAATQQLQRAIELELEPGLYTRLWLWILATDDVRPAVEEDLREFLEFPPRTVTEWDRELGRFALGASDNDAFQANVDREIERRIEAGENLDDLACEAQFYVGLRNERDASIATEDDERLRLLAAALDAHRAALRYRPTKWKWEWAFARAHFARLASAFDLQPLVDFEVHGSELVRGDERLTIERGLWHAVGAERAVAELGRAPQPGDLFLARVRLANGEPKFMQLFVDAR